MNSYTNAVKKNISSMQVLKTLYLLMEDSYSMEDLIKKLNRDENEAIFNNSVVSKYINTCRACGIQIPKINNKYFVANLPFGLELSAKDIDILTLMQKTALENLSSKQNLLCENFLTKLSIYCNKHFIKTEKNTFINTQELFSKAIEEKRIINLILKKTGTIKCIPLAIIGNEGQVLFSISENNEEKLIPKNMIAGIELTEKRFVPVDDRKEVEFILSGGLAKRYSARENEEVLDGEGYIIVKNYGENKDILLSRLLRYSTSCEIISPISYREEMKRILAGALENYGE